MRTLSRTKLPQPYLILAKNMLKKISNDLCIIKKSMASRGLKVYESAQDVNEVSYDVIIRGYEEKIKFKRVIMKRISEEYLVHYMHINHRRATD